jgi:hypothetical protein
VDSLEGTVLWEYDSMACPQTIVRLYKGMMKVYVNQSNTYEGSTAVVEHQDKDQAGEEEEGMYLKWVYGESCAVLRHNCPCIITLLLS